MAWLRPWCRHICSRAAGSGLRRGSASGLQAVPRLQVTVLHVTGHARGGQATPPGGRAHPTYGEEPTRRAGQATPPEWRPIHRRNGRTYPVVAHPLGRWRRGTSGTCGKGSTCTNNTKPHQARKLSPRGGSGPAARSRDARRPARPGRL